MRVSRSQRNDGFHRRIGLASLFLFVSLLQLALPGNSASAQLTYQAAEKGGCLAWDTRRARSRRSIRGEFGVWAAPSRPGPAFDPAPVSAHDPLRHGGPPQQRRHPHQVVGRGRPLGQLLGPGHPPNPAAP